MVADDSTDQPRQWCDYAHKNTLYQPTATVPHDHVAFTRRVGGFSLESRGIFVPLDRMIMGCHSYAIAAAADARRGQTHTATVGHKSRRHDATEPRTY